MTVRFEFNYSIAANLATLNDILVSMSLYLMCGGEVTLNGFAACLTLLGYSVNDTIVNFDRIRENLVFMKDKSYREIVNISINQTLARTVLTSLTVLLVLLMQLLFGGSSIRDFVLIMLFGVIVGTFSTIFIATILMRVLAQEQGNEGNGWQTGNSFRGEKGVGTSCLTNLIVCFGTGRILRPVFFCPLQDNKIIGRGR